MLAKKKIFKTWKFHNSLTGVDQDVECVSILEEATLETWVDNVTKLSAEFGIPADKIHKNLFDHFPEIFGPPGGTTSADYNF